MVEYKSFNITNLLLNPVNPRYNPVEHQTESINAMVQDQEEKLVTLARHIVENGLNPMEIILVKYDDGKWVVREGNRRVTALKLLNEPSLTPPEYPKIKKEFQSLGNSMGKKLLQEIPCVILDDESEINEWVRLKHTGQNQGAGTVAWDSQQSSRFKAYVEGKPDMRTTFFEYLLNFSGVPDHIRTKLYNIKKTNFDRLMGDPDVRKLLGLRVEENSLVLSEGINRFLLMVLEDLIKDLSVGEIYHKSDREAYIRRLTERTEELDYQDQSGSNNVAIGLTSRTNNDSNGEFESNHSGYNQEKASQHGGSDNNSSVTDPKRNNGERRSYPVNRNTIVASIHKLKIGQPRLLKIFNELKTINVNDYPNASAVLFRSFIELSADYFLEKNRLMQGKISVDSSLGAKIDAVAKHIQDIGLMNEHQLRSIRQMTSSPTHNQSVKTFHAYVHNKDVTPSATDLKAAWDDIWLFIEKIWS